MAQDMDDDDIDQMVMAQRARMDQKMEDARESAKRSLQMLDNSLATGVDTIVELDRQGEQLRRASRRLDSMEGHMKESDRLLRGMGSWFGALYNKIAAPGPAYATGTTSTASSSTAIEPLAVTTRPRPSSTPPSSSVSSLLVDPEAKRFWEESDAHLDQMDERIERLHALARDMGNEVEKQTHEIEALDTKVQQTTEGLMERTLKIFRLT
jgi:prefoldin subunit 5